MSCIWFLQISDESGEKETTGKRWYRKDITLTDKVTSLKVKLWEERFIHNKNLAVGKKVKFCNVETSLWNGFVSICSTAETTYEVQYIINLLRIKCVNYVSCYHASLCSMSHSCICDNSVFTVYSSKINGLNIEISTLLSSVMRTDLFCSVQYIYVNMLSEIPWNLVTEYGGAL